MGHKLYKSGIYRIRNTINNKCYYGSAINLDKRWKYEHLRALQLKKHYNDHLQNAWNKYGEENFIFEVIEHIVDRAALLSREQHYLDTVSPEYNISKYATGGSGVKSDETKRKISERKKAWWQKNKGITTGEKHPFFGKHHELETRKRMAMNRKNKLLTPEQVLQIRETYVKIKISHRKLAEQFSVGHRTIGKILKRQIYIYV